MKFGFILLSILFFLFTGCKKDELDLDSNTYFGIKAILNSENCNADCEETANCEGKMIKVKGFLDENNINASEHQFYLIDEKKDKYILEVKVDETVSSDVFQKLNGQGGQVFLVEGLMEGYDAPTNINCKRQFILRLDDAFMVNK